MSMVKRTLRILGLLLLLVSLTQADEVTQEPQQSRERKLADVKRGTEEASPGVSKEAEAHYQLGKTYLREPQNTEKAVEHLEKAVELDSRNAEYHFRLAEAYTADFPYANIIRKPFIAAKVKAQLEQAVKYDPQSVQYREGLIQYYVLAPAILGGSFKSAHEQADAIMYIDQYFGTLARAGIFGEEGENEKAMALYRKAIRMRPQAWQAYQRFGTYYLSMRQVEEAIGMFKKFVETAPALAESHEHLGNAYVRKRMYDDAIACYQTAIKKDPSMNALLFRIAQLYEFKGAKKEAVQHYERYISVIPSGQAADDARAKIQELSR